MYDLIGDIHGHAEPLRSLLLSLGYREQGGVWRHPHRKVIFLGDFVDRGPEQVEVVAIARNMVEAGTALAVMGNHEFNAVAWATPDPNYPGEYLRPHSDKNRKQHDAFLSQFGENSELHHDAVQWFRSLPLYLDLPGLRVVHACWHDPSFLKLQACLDGANKVKESAWPVLASKGNEFYEALEVILKGMEVPLPDGAWFQDKDGHPRYHARMRWWWELRAGTPVSWRDLAMLPADQIEQIPHIPAPEDLIPGYCDDIGIAWTWPD